MPEPYKNENIIALCGHMARSFSDLVGRPLIARQAKNPIELAKQFYEAKPVIAAHLFEDMPRFRFANLTAQALWGYDWEEFNGLDSRRSAQPVALEEREALLRRAQKDGYVDDYQGVRITKEGRRFEITNVVLCSIFNDERKMIGQTAMFKEVRFLDKKPTPLNHPKGFSFF